MTENTTTEQPQDKPKAESKPKQMTPAEVLLTKLRKVSGRATPARLQRSAIMIDFPGVSFVWVRDKTPHSSVAEYKAMGYQIFELPPGVDPEEMCPAATVDGSRLRLEDTILMYTSVDNANAIMKAVQDQLKMTKIDQSELIKTGSGKDDDPRPAGKESTLELEAREPLTPEQAQAIIEARNKLRGE